jgi:hypothetical protein
MLLSRTVCAAQDILLGPDRSARAPQVPELRISVGSSASTFAVVSIFAPKLTRS